jgi:23S rRNA (pseudouridine1915-N3)-methyltransferase
MKIVLMAIGKTDDEYLVQGIDRYVQRVAKYIPFAFDIIPDLKQTKNLGAMVQKEKEGELILKRLVPSDYVILLDEGGRQFSSANFASHLNTLMVTGYKRIIFVIGGPYGFSPAVYQRAVAKIALSPMTFSHQMVRLIFTEQLYRAFTILKGEPYHHE